MELVDATRLATAIYLIYCIIMMLTNIRSHGMIIRAHAHSGDG